MLQGAAAAGAAPLIVHVGTSTCGDPMTTCTLADAARERFEAHPPPARFVLGRLPLYSANYAPAGSWLFALRSAAAAAKFWAMARALEACGRPEMARKLEAGTRVGSGRVNLEAKKP